MRRTLPFLACLLGCAVGLAACSSSDPPLTLATNVDLQRYAGKWYIISNIPYFAERGKVGSYFEISFDGDKVKDVYVGQSRTFDAAPSRFTMNGYVVPDTGNARWRESPFWPVYLSYLILHVDADYQAALVGYPGRGFGWVLARSPMMDEASYQAQLGLFAAQGYDISQFRRVPQTPEQIGQPGFQ